jgi:hypothetical protein
MATRFPLILVEGQVVEIPSSDAFRVANIPTMVGDTGAGGTAGAVPAPGAGDAAAGKFLKADGTYAVPSADAANFGRIAAIGAWI